MLKKMVMICVLVSTGCTTPAEKQQPVKSQVTPPVTPQSTAPATARLKAPIRKSGPNAVFKSTRSPYSIASCLHYYWTPDNIPPGLIMETEHIELKDENGVMHKFTREVVNEAATKAAKDNWNKYHAKKKPDFEVFGEKWGYSVRNTKAGSKMADIYAENDYSVVNYYFSDVPQYSTVISYSVGYGSSSGEGAREGVREKIDLLNDRGLNYCVKESLYKPHNSAEKNRTGQRADNDASSGLIESMVKALAATL